MKPPPPLSIWQGLPEAPRVSGSSGTMHTVSKFNSCQKRHIGAGRRCHFLKPCHTLKPPAQLPPHGSKLLFCVELGGLLVGDIWHGGQQYEPHRGTDQYVHMKAERQHSGCKLQAWQEAQAAAHQQAIRQRATAPHQFDEAYLPGLPRVSKFSSGVLCLMYGNADAICSNAMAMCMEIDHPVKDSPPDPTQVQRQTTDLL